MDVYYSELKGGLSQMSYSCIGSLMWSKIVAGVASLVESRQSLFGQDQATDVQKTLATYKFDTFHIQLDR